MPKLTGRIWREGFRVGFRVAPKGSLIDRSDDEYFINWLISVAVAFAPVLHSITQRFALSGHKPGGTQITSPPSGKHLRRHPRGAKTQARILQPGIERVAQVPRRQNIQELVLEPKQGQRPVHLGPSRSWAGLRRAASQRGPPRRPKHASEFAPPLGPASR